MTETRKAAKWAKLFDASLAVHPPLGPEALAEIPAKRGVFLLAGEGGGPVLLATAADIRARVRHRLAGGEQVSARRADLREVAAALWWKLADSHFETDWQYLRLARAIYPDTYPALLSFQPAWFVHVDPDEAAPAFRRSKEVFARAGQFLGPFPDKHAAQRFIERLVDGFDLCRNEQILRRAPRGSPCAYAQMGRCRAWCDGSAPMDEYRRLLGRACEYAAGDRQEFHRAIAAEMRRLSGRREYERAAACKARLDRLAELEADAFAHVADARRFRYLYVQPGARAGEAKVFLVDRGRIKLAGTLSYPPQAKQLARVLRATGSFLAKQRPPGRGEREGIGLVTHYLFGAAERRGLPIRWQENLTPDALAERIESAAAALKLRRPARSAGKKSPSAKAR